MDVNYVKAKASKKNYNLHYLNRYLRLLARFSESNNITKPDYTEEHHILPKASDMFPEYEYLKENLWNKIDLTARQHYIAHWLLWKIFGGSQAYVFRCFNTQAECKNNQRESRRITSRVYEQLRKDQRHYLRKINLGKATYIDEHGSRIYCYTDDPRVISGELIALSKGRKQRKRTKETSYNLKIAMLRHHREKPNQPIVYLYKLADRIEVIRYSDEYNKFLEEGWSTRCTPERKSYIAATSNRNRDKPNWSLESREKASKRFKGKKRSKEFGIASALGRRKGTDEFYEILVYNTSKDKFETIDRLYFDENDHMLVAKRINGVSKKIINLETDEILLANPDLPRFPDNYVLQTDTKEVTVYDKINRNFLKLPKYKLNDNFIVVCAPNGDRIKKVDVNGVQRYVQKEIADMMSEG